MKENSVKTGRSRGPLVLVALAVLAAVATGLYLGYDRLHELWLEQCVLTDAPRQVTVNAGRMVKADAVREALGLRNGVNTAKIDFDAERDRVLGNPAFAMIKSLAITRYLPNRVAVTVVERTPAVRLGCKGTRYTDGRVADEEGVVFVCRRGTDTLPLVRETGAPASPVGSRLKDLPLAAVQLLQACEAKEFRETLGILEADATGRDYLKLTLSENYSQAKIAWDSIHEPTGADDEGMLRQLRLLAKTIRSRVGEGAVIWDATDTSKPGRIYANTQEKIQ